MNKLPLSTVILVLAQALNLTTAVLSVTIAAIVGGLLVDDPAYSTVPYGLQFASVMLFTFPASWLMKQVGRKKVFLIGACCLFLAGLCGFFAIQNHNFYGLMLAHGLLGLYIAIANFYRFAATDGLEGKLKSSALSFVVSGGVLAAFLGPWIASHLKSVDGYRDFALCYASLSLIAILTVALISAWRPIISPAASPTATVEDSAQKPLGLSVTFAIVAAAWGYFCMNLLMIQSSLMMHASVAFEHVSHAMSSHVLAMFLPSFFVGYLIQYMGERRLILLGYFALFIVTYINLFYQGYQAIYTSLIVLGIGWNFMYVAGGALLTKQLNANNTHRWQGINDTMIALLATLGAFLPAPLLATLGWKMTNLVLLSLTICLLLGFALAASSTFTTKFSLGKAKL
jgi:predicted MFS family arabinose efflux permease